MTRLGLCCVFRDAPIKFSTTTAAHVGKLARSDALAKLSAIALTNAKALQSALEFCRSNGIGCFRVNSRILPLKTHPLCGYRVEELPEAAEILARFRTCGAFATEHDVRTCFHPDQFVVLNSRRADVVASSLLEIEYQAEVADWIAADVINVHAGGAFGDKAAALADFRRGFERLSERARRRLTLENDDTTFTPTDLLATCRDLNIPLVYDVHHHRCRADDLSIEEATEAAVATWGGREPMFHLSSPIEGWDGPHPERHHDFIDPADFPDCWKGRRLTVEVEAKAKEAAVLRLRDQLGMSGG